jgi:hypothetical protein
MMLAGPRRTLSVLVVAGLSLALGACGSDSSSSASTCSSLQKLAASVRDLTNVDVTADGTNGIKAKADAVDSAWKQAKKDASGQFGQDLDRLQRSVSDLGTTVEKGRGSASIGTWLSTLGDDVTAVTDAYRALQKQVKSELSNCDLSA